MLVMGVGGASLERLLATFETGEADALDFGALEPLAALIQETAPDALQSKLIEEIRGGTELRTIVAAAALANARTFGGHDYIGYHCQMALLPALRMSKFQASGMKPLPVLKVLYRTATRIQERGGRSKEALHAVSSDEPPARLREAFLERDVEAAERALAVASVKGKDAAFEELQSILQENLDVHRVVLAWRAYEGVELTGDEHAATMLRQSVRFCIDAEKRRHDKRQPEPELRSLLPELLEEHGLTEGVQGRREASDEELAELGRGIFRADKADAARAVAEALGTGLAPDSAGEALALAANQLVLHDPGRTESQATWDKPPGSVHGASPGVHASDAAHAWRNIAAVSPGRDGAASLIAGAYHTAGQSGYVAEHSFDFGEELARLEEEQDIDRVYDAATTSLLDGDQALACAAIRTLWVRGYGGLGYLLRGATRLDGALHAEKYYTTVRDNLAGTPNFPPCREAFQTDHLVALARVTASQAGIVAPGYESARLGLMF